MKRPHQVDSELAPEDFRRLEDVSAQSAREVLRFTPEGERLVRGASRQLGSAILFKTVEVPPEAMANGYVDRLIKSHRDEVAAEVE